MSPSVGADQILGVFAGLRPLVQVAEVAAEVHQCDQGSARRQLSTRWLQ